MNTNTLTKTETPSPTTCATCPFHSTCPHALTLPGTADIPVRPTPQTFALKNTGGFWELSRGHDRAVLPQHHAWFYIAVLLAEPASIPLSSCGAAVGPDQVAPAGSTGISPALSIRELSRKVFAQYSSHPDFLYGGATWLRLHADETELAAILKLREDALEQLLRRERELDIIKAEALAELDTIYELQEQLPLLALANVRDYSRHLLQAMQSLHAKLACAVTPRGEPHSLLRAFAAYLFHQLILPSLLLQDSAGNPQFVHLPPAVPSTTNP